MTKKQDPIEMDASIMILHSSQSIYSFEEYIQRVARSARIKLRRVSKDVKEP
jgi:hypothetical protein